MDRREALDVLELRPGAGAGEVKRAYRRLARELHPDRGGDADRFRMVTAAYELLGDGETGSAPAPQERNAGVDQRWWETPGAWHEEPVDTSGVELDTTVPDGAAVRMDTELLATLLHDQDGDGPVLPVRLHSRSPGSRLHRLITLLDPDLLAAITLAPATSGTRAGHDVEAELRATGGRGRRVLADAPLPPGWTRSRGSESVRVRRALRPCRDRTTTAVRVAREVDELARCVGWPLQDWFLLRPGDEADA